MKTGILLALFSLILSTTLSMLTIAHADDRVSGLLPLSSSVLDELENSPRPTSNNPVTADQLALVVPFSPVRDLYEQVKSNFSLPALRNRGEAHITVITPPEFAAAFSGYMSAQSVMQIMQSENLAQSRFEAVCLGRGNAVVKGQMQSTFFVVVRSPDLIRIRRTLRAHLAAAGGDTAAFDADSFYPHITVGFTLRDLHERDGITKDIRTCSE